MERAADRGCGELVAGEQTAKSRNLDFAKSDDDALAACERLEQKREAPSRRLDECCQAVTRRPLRSATLFNA